MFFLQRLCDITIQLFKYFLNQLYHQAGSLTNELNDSLTIQLYISMAVILF